MRYVVDYKDNETGEYKSYEFEAANDFEARLIAEEFCNEGWHKLYGVLKVGDK